MILIILISFIIGLLFSPWSAGLLWTIIIILMIEGLYWLIWPWGPWRLWIILASLSGWAIGKLFFVPLVEQHRWKIWIDQRISTVKIGILGGVTQRPSFDTKPT